MSRALSRLAGSQCCRVRPTTTITSTAALSPLLLQRQLSIFYSQQQNQQQQELLENLNINMPGKRKYYPKSGGSNGGKSDAPASKRAFSTRGPSAFSATPMTQLSVTVPKLNMSSTPFTSVSDTVDQKIMDNIKKMGFTNMTDAQAMTLPIVLSGKDIIAQAKTGTGKTVAFLLPIMQRLLTEPQAAAMIIAPTRELAHQIADESRKLGRGFLTENEVQVAVGGENRNKHLSALKRGYPRIFVATPGRLKDFSQDREASSILSSVKWKFLVLDEADRLLSTEFKRDIDFSLTVLLGSESKNDRQNMLFSATMPEFVRAAALDMVRDSTKHEFVSTLREEDVNAHERIPQHVITLPDDTTSLLPSIAYLVAREAKRTENFKAVAFFPTARQTGLMNAFFESLNALPSGVQLHEIHSRLSQSKRNHTAEEFRKCRSGILFSSDVTARGMDFPDVTHVFQVGLPADGEQYIHRLGRTGRAGKNGICYTMLYPYEALAFGRYTQLSKLFALMKTEVLPEAEVDRMRAPSEKAIRSVSAEVKNSAYAAWLGYYKAYTSKCQIKSNTELVDMANQMAMRGWGMPGPPLIHAIVVGKMGLKDASAGLNIDRTPRASRNANNKNVPGPGGPKPGVRRQRN